MAAYTEAARNEVLRNAIEAVITIGAIPIALLWCFEIGRPFVGIVGLFIGAVIRALGYELFIAWVYEPDDDAAAGSAAIQAEQAAG